MLFQNETDAEAALLHAAMQDAASCEQIVRYAEAEDFVRNRNAAIFSIIKRLHETGSPVSMVTVTEAAPDLVDDVIACADAFLLPSHVSTYLDILRENRRRRDFSQDLEKVMQAMRAHDPAYMDMARQAITKAASLGKATVSPVGAAACAALESMGKRDTGLKTGFKDLDWITNGLKVGEMVVLGARPGLGKTSLALNIALTVAKTKRAVAVVSLETPQEALLQRLIACVAQRSKYDYMRQDALSVTTMQEAAKYIAELPLYISDDPRMTIDRIAAYAHSVEQQVGGLSLLVVDYLGLIEPTRRKNSSREQEVSEISRRAKLLSGELSCPVLLLAQLNRGIETRGEYAVPRLSDLRESGSIEQDADMVWFLYREDADCGTVNLHVAKNRNGKTGRVVLQWTPEHFRFDNVGFQNYAGKTPFDTC